MLALFYIFIAIAFSIGIWQVNKLLRFTKKTRKPIGYREKQ
jgi:cytochrome oxidase assembly protein ShyY1